MKQWEFPSSAEWSLHPPLRWLGWRVKADRDCSASGVGSRNHSPLECCLVRYSLNSHTNRWIALPLFFFLTCAKHWHFTELSWSSASKHPTVGKWMNLTCLHALKNTNPIFDVHFFFLSPIFLVIQIILHSTHLCFAATANQNDLSHKSAQLQGRVSVIYFWWLA